MDKMNFVIFDHWLDNYVEMINYSDNAVLKDMYKRDVDYFSEVLSDEWSDNRNSSEENVVDDSWKNAEAVVASLKENEERRIFLNAENGRWLTSEDIFYSSDELMNPVVPDIDFSYEKKLSPKAAMLKDIERYTRVRGQEVDSDDALFEISKSKLSALFSLLSETFDMFVDLPEFVPFVSLVDRYGRAVRSLEWYLSNGYPLNEFEVSPIVFTDKGLFVRMYFNKSERVFLPNWIFVSDDKELRERILGTSDRSQKNVSGENNE